MSRQDTEHKTRREHDGPQRTSLSKSNAKLPAVANGSTKNSMSLNDRFRELVKELVKDFEMTQANIAALLGCGREHISNVVNDHKEVSQALVNSLEAHVKLMRKTDPKEVRKNALLAEIDAAIADLKPDKQTLALQEILHFIGTLKSFGTLRSR